MRRTFLAACAVLIAACGDNVVSASYATLAEARTAGAVERGWIPEGLPASARDMREAHDRDSNRRWGLFSFDSSDAGALKALLSASELPLGGQSCDVPGRLEWWPVLLRGDLDAEQIAATGLKAYTTADRSLIVLVNWSQGRAYYWRAK
jgi:hypothetical protein